ncbi:MAG: hypothetical protein ACXVAX_03830, partial [Pseudobdellovibrio sp.]
GYDLVVILSLITRDNFSGNLIIVNEEDLLSGITFIYGDIVKVDYPDQEHMLGNLIVDNEVLSKFEMQEIIEKSGGVRLGDYLVDNNYITQQQLRKLLFKQTTLRLTKYLNSLSIRIKFTFDGESNDNILINKIDYVDILYKWVFNNFKDNWLEDYHEFYRKNEFYSELGTNDLQFLKDYPEVYNLAFKISQFKKSNITYNDIFKVAQKTRQDFVKVMHFMILSGSLFIFKNREAIKNQKASEEKNKELLENLDNDLKLVQINLLKKKYFEAFGILNKYSAFMKTHPTVSFYFIWIKLMGAYYNNHLIDIKKISQDFFELDYFKVNPGEFYYVRALLLAVQRQYKESDDYYQRAVTYNVLFKNYPINMESSFLDRIVNFFKSLNIKN